MSYYEIKHKKVKQHKRFEKVCEQRRGSKLEQQADARHDVP